MPATSNQDLQRAGMRDYVGEDANGCSEKITISPCIQTAHWRVLIQDAAQNLYGEKTIMLEETTLVTLLGRVACGDQVAFRQLYDAMSPRIYGLCLKLLQRRDLAEDVLQDAFVRIWHHAGEYHAERGTPAGWMLTVARYRALDVLRRRRFEVSMDHDSLQSLVEQQPSSMDNSNDETTFLALQGCLDEISPQQRQSILQAYYHGLSHEQLASSMQAPLGTVKSWVRRGLTSLKRCLEQ